MKDKYRLEMILVTSNYHLTVMNKQQTGSSCSITVKLFSIIVLKLNFNHFPHGYGFCILLSSGRQWLILWSKWEVQTCFV